MQIKDYLMEEFKGIQDVLKNCEKNGLALKVYSDDPDLQLTGDELVSQWIRDMLLVLSITDGATTSGRADYLNALFNKNYTVESYDEIYRQLYEEIDATYLNIFFEGKHEIINYIEWLTEQMSRQKNPYPLPSMVSDFIQDVASDFYKETNGTQKMLENLNTIVDNLCGHLEQIADTESSEEVSGDEEEAEEEKTLEELLEELNQLVGLASVKKELHTLINLMEANKLREEKGMKKAPVSNHLVFSGNPGTGKTTIGRLLGNIYQRIGVLSEGHVVETDRSNLVGQYVGQTAIQTKELAEEALGGILFVDEAYSLVVGKSERDTGQEAVDTLLKFMEDHRDDFIVIAAGYPEPMEKFLSSNPGLRSRFNKFIEFDDYTGEELYQIFSVLAEGSDMRLEEEAVAPLKKYFTDLYEKRDETFANGRDVRNFFEVCLSNQANRLATLADISDVDLATITLDDLPLFGE